MNELVTIGRRRAARTFIRVYRRKRDRDERGYDRYRPAPLLAIWVAWEHARDDLALSIADDVAAGRDTWPEDAEAYRIVEQRILDSAARYSRNVAAKAAAR